MPESHEGGCLCGAVRYRAVGDPDQTEGTGVCHCRFCQRRTGSAFGVTAYFPLAAVEIISGQLKTYEYRSDLSHHWLRMEFCPNCGTTVTWMGEWNPALRAIAVGTFDDPKWLRPAWQIFSRSALPWIVHPPGVDSYDSNPYVNIGEQPKRY